MTRIAQFNDPDAAVMSAPRRRTRAWLLAAAATIVVTTPAFAQEADEETGTDEIVVTADRAGLFKERNSATIGGISKPLTETPRSVSVVSELTLDRYGIEDIDDFITTSPGTFSGSFFGVPGAVSIRGTKADNYFRGFRRTQNSGLYPAPIGSSSRIELVRGPTPAILGSGSMGGLMNIYPKTAVLDEKSLAAGPEAIVGFTIGSYDKKVATFEYNHPFLLGGRKAGVSLYGEFEDSKDFVIGRKPQHELVQASFLHELPNDFEVEVGGMYLNTRGYYQNPGWNRVTQDLVDNGTYITGRDTDLQDTDGNGRLTPNEIDASVGRFFGLSNIRQFIDYGGTAPAVPGTAFDLDTGVGTTQLSRRQQFISPGQEVQNAETFTGYFDLTKTFDNSTLKAQLFYENVDARVFVSSGFATQIDSAVFEARLTYQHKFEISDAVKLEFFTAASHRIYDALAQANYNGGFLTLDRRDISVGAMPNDILDSPFSSEPGNIGIEWERNQESRIKTTGLAGVLDLTLWDALSINGSGRYDHYSARSIDTGTVIFNPADANTLFHSKEDDFSYAISVNYKTPFGLVPYFTYAESSVPSTDEAGGAPAPSVRSGSLLRDSKLTELGVKFATLNKRVEGSLAYYKQKRVVRDPFGNFIGETGKGWEAELRVLLSDYFTWTGTATIQDFTIGAPGTCGSGQGEFVVLPPSRLGLTGQQAYGGLFAALNASCLTELQNGYRRNVTPKEVYSTFITYTSPELSFGTIGGTLGTTYVSKTGGKIDGGVVLPSYFNTRAAAFVEVGRVNLTLNIDNLFNEKYFTPLQGVYEEVGVMPNAGRTFRLTGKYRF
ncbi:TonB-dependent siderophore receptor [Parasphingorhabdus sp.]|uniref:TonB-dependent siderophore receptor n=1 Tax=Parasphingorhabdus sp. TaxID=2709688 RepID=UPI003A91A5EA